MLRGGGPKLTVSYTEMISGRMHVSVNWFVDGDELKYHTFFAEALVHAD